MAAPVQRGTAHATFTTPTSTLWTIDATTFRIQRLADAESIKNESAEDFLEVFTNPSLLVSFTGTLKSGQTPAKPGDLVTLTFPASHTPTGAVEGVIMSAEDEGHGKVIKQSITWKYNAAASDYSPA